MGERIPQSTTIRVPLWAFLSSDHVTPATGKTIAITISKNGAAFGNPNAGATNATAVANGWYYVDLDTTDTGTLGPLIIRGAEGTIDDVGIAYDVVSATSGGYTNLDAAVSSRLATASYTAPLDAAGTRSAVGLAAANLDTQLGGIATDTTTDIPAQIAALNNLSAAQVTAAVPTAVQNATAVRTGTTMAESYAADGAAPTLEQALFAIMQYNQDRAIAGTSMTVFRLDGTTPAMVMTLDSAVSPTTVERTS